jgi:hypothetical protein
VQKASSHVPNLFCVKEGLSVCPCELAKVCVAKEASA